MWAVITLTCRMGIMSSSFAFVCHLGESVWCLSWNSILAHFLKMELLPFLILSSFLISFFSHQFEKHHFLYFPLLFNLDFIILIHNFKTFIHKRWNFCLSCFISNRTFISNFFFFLAYSPILDYFLPFSARFVIPNIDRREKIAKKRISYFSSRLSIILSSSPISCIYKHPSIFMKENYTHVINSFV